MAAPAMAQFESAPAFPGAEGHARFVTGGRGGSVVHVTNLNDSGTGSFRAAVSGSSKKIVVFDVGGVIPLESDLTIGANTTILGQTAPYPGITLRYYTVSPGNNNIIRYIRVRRGQEVNVNDGADAMTQRHCTGIMIDHCSLSWRIGDVASIYDNNEFTMQWSTIAEGLQNAGHGKSAHGYGGIWGGKLASFHHNLLAHLSNRGPRFNGARYDWTGYTSNSQYSTYNWQNPVQAENVDFRNCVMYNAQATCYGGPGGGQVNIVNNYYKSGPKGNHSNRVTTVSVSASGNSDTSHPEYYGMTSRYYITGNSTSTAADVVTENTDWSGVTYDSGVLYQDSYRWSLDTLSMYPDSVPSITYNDKRYIRIKMDSPAPTGYITTHSAADAYTAVLKYAGASLDRDEVDERYVTETTNGTATYSGSVSGTSGIPDLVADVEGYTEETFTTGSREDGYDTDNDGMPDAWETQWGLDPNNAADALSYTMDEKGYYTNLEMYANSLVEDDIKAANASGEANFEEYYPELTYVEQSTESTGDTPISLELSQSTNTGSNTSAAYNFETNGYNVSITNEKSKSYATGKEDGIKYSAGVQYTIVLPSDFVASSVTLYGYDNYADVDAYVSELNGQTYESTSYVFPQKDSSGNYVLTSQTIPTAATGSLTFTPNGKQVVWVITVDGTIATGVKTVVANESSKKGKIYNISGQQVNSSYKGLVVCNGAKYIQ